MQNESFAGHFYFEDHPHCKQLSGPDNLGNFVARKRLSMSICTTPTNNSKKNTLSFEQPPIVRGQVFYLFEESKSPQHRNDDQALVRIVSLVVPFPNAANKDSAAQRQQRVHPNLRKQQSLFVHQRHILTRNNRSDDNTHQIFRCIEDSALSVLKICNQLLGKGAQKNPCSDPLAFGSLHCGSARRPPPLIRAEEVSALLEGSTLWFHLYEAHCLGSSRLPLFRKEENSTISFTVTLSPVTPTKSTDSTTSGADKK